jgi:putative glutathione S-transferase
VTGLFDALDRAEALLSERRYLAGDRLTEADLRLWTTLIRFDPVYVTHFKCNVRRIVDYPNLWGYTRELYGHPAFRETTNLTHIKHHYFESHLSINPHQIVPVGPLIDYESPHGREHLRATWFPGA